MATATSNRPGTSAKVRMVRMSASKARVVLNLIRGKQVVEALEILEFTERLAADPIAKCLKSAIANAVHNEDLSADELFISACFADEGPTLKRFRPRARGRAGRIHKQTCHITIEVARFTDDELDEARKRNDLKNEGRQKRSSAKGSGSASGGDRAARVAKSRAAAADEAPADEVDEAEETVADDSAEEAAETAEAKTDVTADEAAEAAESGADESDATDEAASAGDEEE